MRLTKKNRQKIKEKSEGHCWYCGCELGDKWHADHFEPVLRNSSNKNLPEKPENDVIENIVPACTVCNLWKKTFSIEQFRTEISKQVERLRRDSSGFRMAEKYSLVEETKLDVKFWYEHRP